MKHIFTTILMLAFALSSCIKEQTPVPYGETAEVQTVMLGLASPAKINIADDRMAYLDYEVSGLRVIGYNTNTGQLAFNTYVVPTSDGSNTSANANENVQWSADAQVITGDFTVVFIANETVDPGLAASLSNNGQISSLAKLQNLTLNSSALTWNGVIPMLAVYEDVRIKEDNTLTVSGAPISSPWEVELKHLAVRVDFTLNMDKAQAKMWEDAANLNSGSYLLTVKNVPQKQYLFPGMDNSSFARADRTYNAQWTVLGYPKAAGLIEKDLLTEDYTVTFPRLILPESYFSDQTNKNKALAIATDISLDGTSKTPMSGTIGYNIDSQKGPVNYTLPRNTYLTVNATMPDVVTETDDLGIKISVNEWESGYYEDVTPGTYFLGIEWTYGSNPDIFLNLSHGSHQIVFNITCTHPDGWTWEFFHDGVGPHDDWVKVAELPGWWDTFLEIKGHTHSNEPGQESVIRTGWLHFKAGNLTKVVKFKQASALGV